MIEVTDEMVEELSDLVWGIVHKVGRKAFWDDLFQAGFEGLLLAARKYDPDNDADACFSTFAYKYIWRAILEENRRLRDTISRYSTRAGRKISNRIGRVGPDAESIGVTSEELEEWQSAGVLGLSVISYDEESPISALERNSSQVIIWPEEPEYVGLRGRVAEVAKDLPHVEKTILYTRLYTSEEPLSQTELSRRLGVSRNWIWQKENECLEILRRNLRATPI